MSDGLRRLVVAAVLAAAGTALADDGATTRPWSTLDTEGLVRAVQVAPAVVLADLQAERARLAAVAAGAFVGGSVRIGAETAWRSDASGPSAPAGWEAGLGAISVSTSWYLVPSGPTHDAATRAVRGYEVALAAGLETRRDAILDAFDRIAALERLYAQAALTAHRLDLARRSRNAVASQAEAGTASPAALAEADLAVAQADGDRVDAMADIAAAELAFERAVGTAAAALWAPPTHRSSTCETAPRRSPSPARWSSTPPNSAPPSRPAQAWRRPHAPWTTPSAPSIGPDATPASRSA